MNYDQVANALLFLNGLSLKVLRHIILLIGLIQARKWLHLQIVLFCLWLPLEMTSWDLDPVGYRVTSGQEAPPTSSSPPGGGGGGGGDSNIIIKMPGCVCLVSENRPILNDTLSCKTYLY